MHLEGYLSKQGGGISKSFKRRFFRLTSEYELTYYKSEKEAERGKSQGFINLNKVLSVERGSEIQKGRSSWRGKADGNYYFDVVTQERIYHLVAATEEEQLRWMDGISNAVQTLHPASPITNIKKLMGDSRSFSSSDMAEHLPSKKSRLSMRTVSDSFKKGKSNSVSDLTEPNRLSQSIDCTIADCEQLLSAINST